MSDKITEALASMPEWIRLQPGDRMLVERALRDGITIPEPLGDIVEGARRLMSGDASV